MGHQRARRIFYLLLEHKDEEPDQLSQNLEVSGRVKSTFVDLNKST